MNKLTKKEKGFTIIEVVLVLAIAGLIFLVVFLALPALQKSQRDSQRKSDIGRVVSALQTYSSNNNGKLPTTIDSAFITTYVGGGSAVNDPDTGAAYTVTTLTTTPTSPDAGAAALATVYVVRGQKCSNGSAGAFASGNTNGNVSVFVKLESGGSYCQYI